FNPVAMAWWRFRESLGIVVFEYAAQESGPWTELARTLNPFVGVGAYLELGAGHYSATTSDLVVKFDDASVDPAPPPPPPPGSGPGTPVWVGDFETGSFSQWSFVDAGGGGIVRTVTSPVAQGRFAAELTVTPTAHSSPAAGSDSVVIWNSAWLPPDPRANGYIGSDDWYRFRIYFPADYVAACGYFNWVGAVHHSDDFTSAAGGNGSPYFDVIKECWSGREVLAVRLLGGDLPRSSGRETWIKLDGSSQTGAVETFAPTATGPALERGRWYDFTYHVTWSPDPSVGLFELYLDDRLVWSGNRPTLWRDPSTGRVAFNNFELGNYRTHVDWNATIYVDDARIGKSWDSVH
ncbi:MAG: polysaccharide lyase, partial [Actinomycetota bacterium]|nr:polysaccharide lyase [Actinomycetota bacterium]